MSTSSTPSMASDKTISRPLLSAVSAPFRELLRLPPSSPSGFTPTRKDTFVETIIDSDNTGIGPISVSTACNHLFCYAVRFEQRNLGIMLITGNAVQQALSNGSVDHGLATLHRQTLHHGPIVFHSLLTVVTPRSSRGVFPAVVLHAGQIQLHQAILRSKDCTLGELPPLAQVRLQLKGWLGYERSVPTCIFDGTGLPLMLHVAWGKDSSDVEHLRIA